jgi:DNA-binding CsgD family transcriptional regulator
LISIRCGVRVLPATKSTTKRQFLVVNWGRVLELELLSAVVCAIYDAAIEPSLWTDALRKTCDFVGGVQAVMFWQDATAGNVVTLHEYNGDPHYTRLYHEVYAPLNPVFPAAMFAEVGSVLAATDHVPAPELHETRFHKEWVAPQGLGDSLGVMLEKDVARAAFLSMIWNYKSPIGEGERRRMALLVPHFQRAVAIGRLFVKQKVENELLTATLDRVDSAVFLVSEGGTIVFANSSGRKMLETGSLLRASGNTLHAVATEADRSLGDSFRALVSNQAGLDARGVTVVLSDTSGERWMANILPLVDGARRQAGQEYHAIAAVFVRNSLAADPTPLETLARLYGLTASEIRVAEAVLRLSGNDAIADALGIGRATVRTHLNHIYRKTGANNQADLIKLIAGLGR